MDLKGVDYKQVIIGDQRPGAKIKYSTPVKDKPKPLKARSPKEVSTQIPRTARNDFYRSARTPGIGN